MKKNDIVFATYRMTPPFFLGGAEISQKILAEELVKAGYNVCCIGSYDHPVKNTSERLPEYINFLKESDIEFNFKPDASIEYSYKGIKCLMTSQGKLLSILLSNFLNTNVLITFLENADVIINLAKKKGIKTVAWIHDVLSVGFSALNAKSDFVLYTSHFVKERSMKLFSREGVVFYPPFNNNKLIDSSNNKPKVITLINPIPEKGLDTFLALSTYFKDYLFIAVEGWRKVCIDIKYLSQNVKYYPKTYDLNPIFSQTRILLAPSYFEEGFCRVITEAGLLGIPAISSNKGGLKEAVGDGGKLVESFEIEKWIEAIKFVDHNKNYSRFCFKAREHSLQFVRDPIQQLKNIGIL